MGNSVCGNTKKSKNENSKRNTVPMKHGEKKLQAKMSETIDTQIETKDTKSHSTYGRVPHPVSPVGPPVVIKIPDLKTILPPSRSVIIKSDSNSEITTEAEKVEKLPKSRSDKPIAPPSFPLV